MTRANDPDVDDVLHRWIPCDETGDVVAALVRRKDPVAPQAVRALILAHGLPFEVQLALDEPGVDRPAVVAALQAAPGDSRLTDALSTLARSQAAAPAH